MIDIDINIKDDDMLRWLDNYEKTIKEQVVIAGVAAAAKVIYDEVKLNTSGARVRKAEKDFVGPQQDAGPPGKVTGTLDSAIYRVYSPERSVDGTKVYKVSVNKTKAPHWFLIEFGHWKTRKKRKRGTAPPAGSAWVPAHPYIRPAAAKMSLAVEVGKERMRQKLDELTGK